MKRIALLFIFIVSVHASFAQKNLVAVAKSDLTGIVLPEGSKKDNRMLSAAGAKMLLEFESNKVKATLSKTEVLVLPLSGTGGFNKDSLVLKLSERGWKIVTVQDDDKYLWLQKEERSVIAYFSIDSKEISLYFADALLSRAIDTKAPLVPQSGPEKIIAQNTSEPLQPVQPVTTGAGGFHFSTTNFDDGWISTVMDDWVEAVKSGIKVLLHYPTSKIDISSSDYKTIANNAWNTLVAPRYSNLQNFNLFPGSADYERAYFISGDVTDNKTGKKEYVVLFKRGSSGWIEIIASDKSTFVQSFGIDISKIDYYVDSSIWDPLKKMSYYNRFAVAAEDIHGKWTNSFTGLQQYVNVYTAADAGMKTHSSVEIFEFEKNGVYRWELKVASGFVGNIKFEGVKSSGNLTLPNNWQLHFSDLEGKPKTYNAYFSCIKGARILWLEDTAYPTGYTGYAKSG